MSEKKRFSLPASLEHFTLPIYKKIAFGFGYVPLAAGLAFLANFLNFFLLEVAKIDAYSVGILLIFGQVWDAFSDPIIGFATDKTNTRCGRRIPWLIGGSIPFAISFFLLWQVPDLKDSALVAYYFVILIILKTSQTSINIPYTALTPQLATEYHDRTVLSAIKSFLAGIIAIIAILFQNLFKDKIPSEQPYQKGFVVGACIFSWLLTVPVYFTVLCVTEPKSKEARENEFEGISGFFKGLLVAIKNRAFVAISMISMLSAVMTQLVSGTSLLYIKYVLKEEDNSAVLQLITQCVALIIVAALAVVSRPLGKKGTYVVGMIVGMVGFILVFFIKENQITQYIVCLAILGAFALATSLIMPLTMLPDVTDLDRLETGLYREGLLYSIYFMFQKLGLGIALGIINFSLGLAGYDDENTCEVNDDTCENVQLVLRCLMSFFPVGAALISFIFIWIYPINQKKSIEIRKELKRLERQSTVPRYT
eukprot:TRINITY_DN2831_c1_g1_i1.p1 TRINITY_DN2831_c1_g1~~TRINITY_DN2831_c1_g1_i1.p1  ORF type:complete len:480 (-),score=219.49 TRINITY_DN2831_c1_g1_i1:193-1632(-)